MHKWFTTVLTTSPVRVLAAELPDAGAEHSAHGAWYWLSYALAILVFGFAIYVMIGARLKRRLSRLKHTLSDELVKVNGALVAEKSSELTEERAGQYAQSHIRRLTDLRDRLRSDVDELSKLNISVFDLKGLNQAISHYNAEKMSIREDIAAEESKQYRMR
ncbi:MULTISPECIES: hypothetical protein [unclassified Paenibacillus]|uniref:hypothetical protein n=1 Tax=unclassified Paenibacillus TaxID=185978 RepID=UPI00119FFD6C|nr:hypothetical protein [Paenibacillus sp. Y412MC10]